MLGVSETTLDTHGAVSEQVAAEMAQGALARSHAHVAVSVTGIAGPGGSAHKPEGRVCFGIARDGTVRTETVEFGPIGRAAVREASVAHALAMVLSEVR
jgi:nicotinamide-nucleotide amidase